MTEPSNPPGSLFDEISTRWTALSDPTQFVMRYSVAIERYLHRLIANPHDALDVMQSFLLNAVQRGFPEASADRGRFRFYLKTAVRHAALMHLRRQATERSDREDHAAEQRQGAEKLLSISNQCLDPGPLAIDEKWMLDWRKCLLDRASDAMLRAQRRNPDNLFHTILDLVQRHTDEDSARLRNASRKPRAAKSQPVTFEFNCTEPATSSPNSSLPKSPTRSNRRIPTPSKRS